MGADKYPNDPRVNLAATFASQSPEERRQRIEAFKASAPANALANYLSAQDYFKSGQTDRAVEELMAASAKPMLQDYSRDFIQNDEEAYRAAGYSVSEAKAVGAISLPLPQLADLTSLTRNLNQLAGLYRQAGDEESARAALQIGLSLGQGLIDQPAGAPTTIHEMVGLRLQQLILEAMDPTAGYDMAATYGVPCRAAMELMGPTREST